MKSNVVRKTLQRQINITFSTLNGKSYFEDSKKTWDDDANVVQKRLGQEAKTLTLSLYRTILRSVRLLGKCNENDEREFKEREEKRQRTLDDRSKDARLNMISMLPAVDPEDELSSRMLYYKQYARENFVQESDCLDNEHWEMDNISRFTYLLKRGEEHRKWLLKDMKFADPYCNAFDLKRVEKFNNDAKEFVDKNLAKERARYHHIFHAVDDGAKDAGSGSVGNEVWDTEDEDETTPVPSWFPNRRDH